MARGGSRQAKPGSMLPNRSDMRTTQAVQANVGGDYGSRKAQESAQAAMPLENTAGVQNRAMAQGGPMPGSLGGLLRPTDRPEEPLTAGIGMGAGPGPAGITANVAESTAAIRLRQMYAKFPNEGLRLLIEQMDNDAR